jgi:cytochrome c oxidase subunit 3/cytochrome o ubiquinol oxidase subunit 3
VANVEANHGALAHGDSLVAGASQTMARGHLTPTQVGVLTFLVTELAFFGTLIMAYIYFLRQSTAGEPNPSQVFQLPRVLVTSLCLFSSSATIHLAERSLRRGGQQAFLGWWGLTIVLGVLFLLGTALEWSDLIGTWGLTISRNLFGTTYFTLVGFHAFHVTVGVIVMSIVFGLALRREITERNQTTVEVVSWFWHFVDGVWLVVFTLVYLVGR